MINVFKKWIDRYFFDEEAITLMLLLLAGLLIVIYMGHVVAPIIAGGIIAFLLQGIVQRLQRWMPYNVAVMITFMFFVGIMLVAMLLAVPIIVKQLTNLVTELPVIANKIQQFLVALQEKYPSVLSEDQLRELFTAATQELGTWGQSIVTFSLSSLPNVFAVMVYGVLIPILVFFFMKDRELILAWLASFLPEKRPFMKAVSSEMSVQVANYARGKAIEIILVGGATYISFLLIGQNYAALLGLLVGLSVIIPYIGAVVVTLPVVAIAYFQWGISDTFGYVLLIYGVIQFLDGNVLVPLLFSEVVNMHPVAIIFAVLVFGGIWGLWGVFFAIPLATLVNALIRAWPKSSDIIEQETT